MGSVAFCCEGLDEIKLKSLVGVINSIIMLTETYAHLLLAMGLASGQ